MKPILSIKGMTHYFGGLKAVSNFNFDIPEGVIYGLIGPNGSGKTTTFNLITGIYTPTEGEITFEGKPIKGLRPYRIVQGGVARTFQNLRIFGAMSAIDNILVARHYTVKSGLTSS
nr:ATP-binding cassette domain-containing protein [Treponema sp.]